MTTHTPHIERDFQEIPRDKIIEADRTDFMFNLGWGTGLTWRDLLQSKRVLIISEAGTGKTYECQTRKCELWKAGEPAFFIELASLSNQSLVDLLSHPEKDRYENWRASESGIATFFLDSIDELKITLGSFRQALNNLAKALNGHLGRARIIVTARPILIDEQIFRELLEVPPGPASPATAEEFAAIAMARGRVDQPKDNSPPDWRNVALLPLSDAQRRQMAIGQGVTDVDMFLDDVRRHGADEFARRPQDLIELCADWRFNRRVGSHVQRVASNVRLKLQPRTERSERTALSPERALDGSRRLALAALLGRNLTLRHSAAADLDGDPAHAPLDPARILRDWSQEECRTLLERPLFGFASYGRVRFHHRSVVEYLAAEQLTALRRQGMPERVLKRLLFVTNAYGDDVVRPTLRPVAAWIALNEGPVFDEILRCDPAALLEFGDPGSLSMTQRRRVLRACIERDGSGGWRGFHVPKAQLSQFAAPDLGPELRSLWKTGIQNPEVREICLALIGFGPMTDCVDIAYGVVIDPVASESERIEALDALIALNDPRLTAIGTEMVECPVAWPESLVRVAAMRLFPQHLSVETLCRVLGRLTAIRGIDGISWNLPRAIDRAGFESEELDELRAGLTNLALDELVWSDSTPSILVSSRGFVLPGLASACLRLIRLGFDTVELFRSTAVALCLQGSHHPGASFIDELAAQLRHLPSEFRRLIFEAQDTLLQEHRPEPNAERRAARLMFDHPGVQPHAQDMDWILASLADRDRSVENRAMMLQVAIVIREEDTDLSFHLENLRCRISDTPTLIEQLDRFVQLSCSPPIAHTSEFDEWRRQLERDEAASRANWLQFQAAIKNDPDTMFGPEHAEATVWNLWQVMERHSGGIGRGAVWDRPFLERHFGAAVADRMRNALMAFWRTQSPTLRSERPEGEKDTYQSFWSCGLAGIAAEAEDRQWASKLSRSEARLAARYVSVHLNGFPFWLEELADAHRVATQEVLCAELTAQLDESASSYSALLQSIEYGAPSLSELFLPNLRVWLDAKGWHSGSERDEPDRASRLHQVLRIVIRRGDEQTCRHLCDLITDELSTGVSSALAKVWLPCLLRLDAKACVDELTRFLEDPDRYGPATEWFSLLFGDRDGARVGLPSDVDPAQLLRLARLAYRFICPSDDIEHHEGPYSPNERDYAERGRGNIIQALLSASGAAGRDARLEMAADPLFAAIRDRVLAITAEQAAREADMTIWREDEIVSLYEDYAWPLQTREDMFALLNDRLDDIDDLLLRDDSPRETWARVRDEHEMRRLIARELNLDARGAYTVDQEAVTADEKETDIRLRSTASDQQAVIELKIGDKGRSATELKAAISEQLLTKYLRAPNSRVGCLLITLGETRTWRHPDHDAPLDFAALIRMLKEEAVRIERTMGASVSLTVRGLDLRPRLTPERVKRGPVAR